MKKSVKIILEVVLFLLCILLVDLIVKSIMKPVNFNKQKAYRESVAIQRLKDIRTLQVAFKSVKIMTMDDALDDAIDAARVYKALLEKLNIVQ